MQVRLMVVDDSAFMRKIVSDAAEKIEGVMVAGTARNGQDAIDSIEKLRPDVITMDIEMPKMNGIDALRIIKDKYQDIPVIMLSSHSKEGSSVTMEALSIGALDFIEKSAENRDADAIRVELEEKLKIYDLIRKKPKKERVAGKRQEKDSVSLPGCARGFSPDKIKAVVIGASTGGPKVLFEIVKNLPGNLSLPVFIVQHMPKGFTRSFAERLDTECALKVVEAENFSDIMPGTVYVAPGDHHMVIDGGKIRLLDRPKLHGVRPAADHLFLSASEAYGSGVLGIILTGMGKDGAAGMIAIKEAGGYNLAQNRETCVVYGMPGFAVQSGVVDEILSPSGISEYIGRIARGK